MLKIAVIGFGHLGKWHSEKVNATQIANLVAIVEKFEANKLLAKEKFPGVKIVDDISAVINEIDAAIVVTPTSTHYTLVKYLLEHDKHVFCEKPLTDSLEDASKIIELSKMKPNLKIQVGHSERFHQAWEILKRDFADYLKGSLMIRIARYAPFKGRATDVNVVDDLMIHDIDLMFYLLGQKPSSVVASGKMIRTQKFDHAHAFFEFSQGHQVSIISSRNHIKEVREIEIASNFGLLHVDLMTLTISYAPKDQVQSGQFFSSFQYEKRDHLLLEHKAFYHSILNNQKTIINENDGFEVVKIIDGVIKSATECKKVVFND